jgi:exosome complex RNA-binding protein Rrp4
MLNKGAEVIRLLSKKGQVRCVVGWCGMVWCDVMCGVAWCDVWRGVM